MWEFKNNFNIFISKEHKAITDFLNLWWKNLDGFKY